MEETIQYEAASHRRRRRLSVLTVLAGLAGALALGVGLVGATRAASAIRATRWPAVPGTILSSEIRRETVFSDIHRDGTVSRTSAERFYVTYDYVASGVRYTGSRFDALTPAGADHPHSAQARYPRGAAVTIHVDPTDPTRAVLEAPWPIATALSALIEIVLGALLLRWTSREIRSGRTAPSDEP